MHLFIHNQTFPLLLGVLAIHEALKEQLSKATIATVQHDASLFFETNVSDAVIAATFNQHGRPIAFLSRILLPNERKLSAIEKRSVLRMRIHTETETISSL